MRPTTAVDVLLGHSNIRHAALLVVAPFGQACVRLPRIRSRRQRTLFENASGRSRWLSTPFPRLSPRGTSGWYDVQCRNCPPPLQPIFTDGGFSDATVVPTAPTVTSSSRCVGDKCLASRGFILAKIRYCDNNTIPRLCVETGSMLMSRLVAITPSWNLMHSL